MGSLHQSALADLAPHRTHQRLFNLPSDKERNPTVLSLQGRLYVGGGADTQGKVSQSLLLLTQCKHSL